MEKILSILKNTSGIFIKTNKLYENELISDLIGLSDADNLYYFGMNKDKENIKMDMINFWGDFKKSTQEAKEKFAH
ncbi:MAG: hypothetical protein LBU22_11730 [Dysgonamonadaceae bacterium]|jgi:hypothetical protein|nr:hypothetical protein [Dysgonamonadaceae bacterium]